ncbi:MAG: alpha/beta fold hydrolase [Phycisphaerae bacterium]|nr:alpha/beta fold hydrolase [Phycisphaerae bacterium]
MPRYSKQPPAEPAQDQKPARRPPARVTHELMLGTAAVLATLFTSGCGLSELRTPTRMDKGLIIILPGIEGRSPLNSSIAKGLAEGGVPAAITIHDWNLAPTFLAGVVNLRAQSHNLSEARRVAANIVAYQNKYPGRPVHVIGHSGGGGVAVYVLEALPPKHEITSAVLLAPAISPDYDLRRALKKTHEGIWNFYSPYDVGFLKLGTSVAGTIDGRMTQAAGAVGFSIPWGLSREDRQLYGERLHQQRYTPKMAESGNTGTHFGWAGRSFVAEWLAPLINSQAEAPTRYAADRESTQ